ncbi:hypothetical protein L5515_010365 [Caenorhabditis briggsae]|uniref:Receptor L-domain domain-containing protein n=1 Tax=Caenorhabditis briggsae TaxID=6238 RepID=A0AAE9ETF0_CAEBR|nr:hypothetical protein L5515_010365 [Caenorhabditis briggsae]
MDLTEMELKANFRNLQNLKGFLKIRNSSLTNLEFFESLETSECGDDGFVIANNPELIGIKFLKFFRTDEKCIWHITNNSKLDISKCRDLPVSSDFESFGNLRDCECYNLRISPESLPYYTNCETISGGYQGVLEIRNLSDSMDLSKFSSLKEVLGRIEVSGTQLTNLSFMGNLENLIVDINQNYGHLSIHNNPNLKVLGWNSLKKLTPIAQRFDLIITNNHPEFCLSTQEAQMFAEISAMFFNEDKILLCPELSRTDGVKVCKIENLEEDCHHVVGDVIIDQNNEMDVRKFKNVTHIYGNLVVRDTKELVDLSFLSNLQNVIRLTKDDDQIIRIISNKKLAIVEFPNMKVPPFPYLRDVSFLEIRDNSQEIFKIQRDCLLIQAKTKTPIKYNGMGCSKLPGKKRNSNGAIYDYYDEDSSNVHFGFTFILLPVVIFHM